MAPFGVPQHEKASKGGESTHYGFHAPDSRDTPKKGACFSRFIFYWDEEAIFQTSAKTLF
jgi:hypothetical protein